MTAPPLTPSVKLFRVSVIIGCTALLIGVAGIFYFAERDRRTRPPLPHAVCFVQLQGLDDPRCLDVVARWQDEEGIAHEEGGEVTPDPWAWMFLAAPEAVPLTLIVYRQDEGGRREVARQPAILTRGGFFEALLRP
jgi:hypothetical protein